MDNKPLISLIIPIYMVEQYISECLDSAVNQSFRQLEIICVDDCGSDSSASIAEQYAERDPRIKILRNVRNLGLSASRNVGIHHSRAPFIMFLDSDDSYAPDMCAKMYRAIVSSGADLAICGTQVSYEADASLRRSDEKYFHLAYSGLQRVSEEIIASCDASVWNKIYRREFLERYALRFPEGMKYEDAFFYQASMAHARSVFFVNEKLYHYRRREGSIMNKTFAGSDSMGADHLRIALALYDYYRRWNLLEKKYANYCRFFLHFTSLALRHSPSRRERSVLLDAACEHARKHLNSPLREDAALEAAVERFRRGVRRNGLGVLFRVEATPLSKSVSVLGIPLYRIFYTADARKTYLCGILLCRRKLRW